MEFENVKNERNLVDYKEAEVKYEESEYKNEDFYQSMIIKTLPLKNLRKRG